MVPERNASRSSTRIAAKRHVVWMPRIKNCGATDRRAIAASRVSRGGDDLGEQRVVRTGTRSPHEIRTMRTRCRRLAVEQQAASLRKEALRRILGVTRPRRVTALGEVRPASTAARRRDATCSCACRIHAHHLLGHRMFHLQTRVHLEEIELRIVAATVRQIEQEFDGSSVPVSGCLRDAHGRTGDSRATPA